MIESLQFSVDTLTCFKQKSRHHTMFPVHYRHVKVTSSLEIEAAMENPPPNTFATNAVRSPPWPGWLPPHVCIRLRPPRKRLQGTEVSATQRRPGLGRSLTTTDEV